MRLKIWTIWRFARTPGRRFQGLPRPETQGEGLRFGLAQRRRGAEKGLGGRGSVRAFWGLPFPARPRNRHYERPSWEGRASARPPHAIATAPMNAIRGRDAIHCVRRLPFPALLRPCPPPSWEGRACRDRRRGKRLPLPILGHTICLALEPHRAAFCIAIRGMAAPRERRFAPGRAAFFTNLS